MLIYHVAHNNKSSLQALDLHELLNGEEVLNFGFDDFNEAQTNASSMIMVQAKDLYLYQIDFINHEVVRKISD